MSFLVNESHESILEVRGSHVLSASSGSLELFGLEEEIDGSFVVSNLFEHLSSNVELLDGAKSLGDKSNNFLDSIFLVSPGKRESTIPGFYKSLRLVEMSILNLEIPVNGPREVALSLEQLRRLNDILARLSWVATWIIIILDFMDHVRTVLHSYSQSIFLHVQLLIHVNSFSGFLSIQIALFSFTVLASLLEELGLLKVDFFHFFSW